ncbi:A disintegrin and metalloproteinase [Mactra antiquata]
MSKVLSQQHDDVLAENFSREYVEEFINTHRLRKDGYTDFTVSVIHLYDEQTGGLQGLNSGILKRLKRSGDYHETPLHLKFTAFNTAFNISLRYNHRMWTPDLPVVSQNSFGRTVNSRQIEDCFMTGQTSHRGSVSLSYCHGITGSIEDGEYFYRLDPLEAIQDDGDEQILVSKSLLQHDTVDTQYINSLMKDNIVNNGGHRERRAIPSTTFTIELCIYYEKNFVDMLEYGCNAMTEQEKVDVVALKYNDVQSRFDLMQEDLGYNVTLKIKTIEFWDPNPAWFTLNVDNLKANIDPFCIGLKERTDILLCDHHHLHLGANDTGKAKGYAKTPGQCGSNNCGLSSDRGCLNGYIPTHELGHTLKMLHDNDFPACAADTGIMDSGGSGTNKWTICNLDQMNEFLDTSNALCLFQENVTSSQVSTMINAINLNNGIQGMIVTDTERCVMDYGDGWESLYWDNVLDYCGMMVCANMNTGDIKYGLVQQHNTRLIGAYCGDGKGCQKNTCVTLAELRATDYGVRQGGWTAWSVESTCSRTCGSGVKVQKRTCTNPTPKNAAPCEGLMYMATLCNTDPCPTDSTVLATLAQQRASEVCSDYRSTGAISSTDYDGTGDRQKVSGNDQCLVKCFPGNSRTALLPNGVGCSIASDWFAELYVLPRSPGHRGYCLYGRCELFGCDGTNGGAVMDYCGVCGGSNSTCTLVDDVYTTNLATGQSHDIPLTAGTKIIQAYFVWSSMKKWFIEVYSSSGVALVKQSISPNTDTTGTINAAGVDWHYIGNKQYLYTTGTITEDIVLRFLNKDVNTNAGIHYGYSTPSDPTVTVSGPAAGTTTSGAGTTAAGTSGTGATASGPSGAGTTTTGPSGAGTTAAGTTGAGNTAAGTTGAGNTAAGTTGAGTTGAGNTAAGTTEDKYACNWRKVLCTNNRCVHYYQLCDGVDDCGDNSDEMYTCGAESLKLSLGLLLMTISTLLKIFL